jgi:hypothetical protein
MEERRDGFRAAVFRARPNCEQIHLSIRRDGARVAR